MFPKPKVANSQSPIQKKRLLEFAARSLKTDKSLQGLSIQPNPNPQGSSSTKVIDFRREIERRYQHSYSNQNYVFPRKFSQTLSPDDSLESLNELGEYDLHTQDFKTSVLLENKNVSTNYEEDQSGGYSQTGPLKSFYNTREILDDSRLTNSKNKLFEGNSMTSRAYAFENKDSNLLHESITERGTKKTKKMSVSKSQRTICGNNMKETNGKFAQKDAKSISPNKVRTVRYNVPDLLPKTINLNVNVNMNMNIGINDPNKKSNVQEKVKRIPIPNAECFINCNFYPKMLTTKSTKDLKVNLLKDSNYFTSLCKNIDLKSVKGNKTSKPLNKGVGFSAMSTTADKSSSSFKSSYSIVQNDNGKLNKSKAKLSKIKKDQENQANQSSLLSFPPKEGSYTSRGNSKSKEKKVTASAFYQKMQQDLLLKLRNSNGIRCQSPHYSPIRNFNQGSLTARAGDSQDRFTSSKKRIPSPKLENLLYASMTNLKTLGQTIMQKNSNEAVSPKVSHDVERKQAIGYKITLTNAKQKEEGISRFTYLKEFVERSDKARHFENQKPKVDKSKMKLNLQGVGKRIGPFSDRICAGGISDRSEMKNKSHAEYFK